MHPSDENEKYLPNRQEAGTQAVAARLFKSFSAPTKGSTWIGPEKTASNLKTTSDSLRGRRREPSWEQGEN